MWMFRSRGGRRLIFMASLLPASPLSSVWEEIEHGVLLGDTPSLPTRQLLELTAAPRRVVERLWARGWQKHVSLSLGANQVDLRQPVEREKGARVGMTNNGSKQFQPNDWLIARAGEISEAAGFRLPV